MARANFVKKARKDYPEHGIKKGESYYWWKFRFGGKHVSKTPPKPSQLTSSDFLSTVLGIEETIGGLTVAKDAKLVDARDDLQAAIDDATSELENLKDETQDKFDNMPEGLQQGDTGQLLENRVSSLDDMIQELEGVDLSDDDREASEALEELQGISYGGE